MSKGPKPSPELIEAIRVRAAAEMSCAAIADELSTRQHELTRSAIAGIGFRNGIKFHAPHSNGSHKRTKRKPGPRRSKRQYDFVPSSSVAHVGRAPTFGTIAGGPVRPPGPRCSWAGCTGYAEPGDMFCHSHGRKGLFSP